MNWRAFDRRATTAAWVTMLFTCGAVFAGDDPPPKPQSAVQLSSDNNSADKGQPRPSDQQIAAWIADLDSNRYRVRERATQHLLSASVAAVDVLLSAANGNRPEPADRAVWVLKQLGESDDYEVAAAALHRLAAVEGRPGVADDAKQALDQLHELICRRKLAKLGGRLATLDQVIPDFGQIQFIHVVLGADWQGTADDLQCLNTLGHHHFFRLEGSAFGDAEVRLFEEMDDLRYLQLFQTRVTPAAIDAIKERQPKATFYVRNQALLGIEGKTHAQGVMVQSVPNGTGAAAAGILAADIITELDGKVVQDFDRLTAQIGQRRPGEQIEVTILRGEEQLTKRVTLGTWPVE